MKEKILAPVMRPFTKRFFAGETSREALAVAKSYHNQGFGVILHCVDYEDMGLEQFPHALEFIAKEYKHLAYEMNLAGLERCALSIKPTQFGLLVSRDAAWHAMLDLVEYCASLRIPVEFDAERKTQKAQNWQRRNNREPEEIAVPVREATLNIFMQAHVAWPACRLAVQACYAGWQEMLAKLNTFRARVRWVEGGVYDDERVKNRKILYETRLDGTRILLERGKEPAFAVVCNERYINSLRQLAVEEYKKPVWLQMLHGFAPKSQERLLAERWKPGMPVTREHWIQRLDIYIPYGRDRAAYSARRLDFVVKHLLDIPKIYRG